MNDKKTGHDTLKPEIREIVGKALDETNLAQHVSYKDEDWRLGIRGHIAERVANALCEHPDHPNFFLLAGVYEAKQYGGITMELEVATAVAKALDESGILKKLNPSYTENLANNVASAAVHYINQGLDYDYKTTLVNERNTIWDGYIYEITSLARAAHNTTGEAQQNIRDLIAIRVEDMTRGEGIIEGIRKSGILTEEDLPSKVGHTDKIAPRNPLGSKGAGISERGGRE